MGHLYKKKTLWDPAKIENEDHVLYLSYRQCSVFTVTPSKIELQTIQYRQSRIWKMKEDEYAKSFAKNQACAIFHTRDIQKNVLLKFVKLCLKTPYWCSFERRRYSRLKPTKTSVFSYKCLKSTLDELIKIYYLMFILRKGMSIEFFNEYIYDMVHPYWAGYLMDPRGRRSIINTAKWI